MTDILCNDKLYKMFSHKKIFFYGLLLKLVFAACFASYFLSDLFLPFIQYFLNSGFENPYAHFSELGQFSAFPYPALMLYILSLPHVLFGFLPDSRFLDVFLTRLPLLLADIGIFYVLLSWVRQESQQIKLTKLYWISPVLIYITYIHGQLDVIPIAFLFVSLALLFKEKQFFSFLVLALAVSTKTHILIVLPFYLIYLFRKQVGFSMVLLYFFGFLLTVFGINAPFLFDSGFSQMVLNNPEQAKALDLFITYPNQTLFYIIPAAYFFLLVRSFRIKLYNKDIFLMLLGFSFGILLLFIPPMQGWYFWLIPFLSYFLVKDAKVSLLPFLVLQVLYALYFLVIPESDYLGVFQLISPGFSGMDNLYFFLLKHNINVNLLKNTVFTLLQTSLLLNCYWLYRKGISNHLKFKISSQPYFIGISGDSGTGKTTLSSALTGVFSSEKTLVLHGDDTHKWERGHQKWNEYTHLNPKANNLHQEIHYLSALKRGDRIQRRHYDHSKGVFTRAKKIRSKNIIIFEGLHSFFIQRIRSLFDLKVFVKPEKQLAVHWKVIRDVSKRNHSKEAVLDQIKKREFDSDKFISSQASHADIIVELLCNKPIQSIGDPNEKIDMYLRFHFPNTVYMDPLIDALEAEVQLELNHSYDENDKQVVDIKGELSLARLIELSDHYIPGLMDLEIRSPQWQVGQLGLIQLLITYYIMEQRSYELTVN